MKKLAGFAGRLLFLFSFGFFMFFFVGETISNHELTFSSLPRELLIIVICFFIMFTGFVLSIAKMTKVGSSVIIAGGIFNFLFFFIKGGIDDVDASIVFGAPFIISGILIFISFDSYKRRYRK